MIGFCELAPDRQLLCSILVGCELDCSAELVAGQCYAQDVDPVVLDGVPAEAPRMELVFRSLPVHLRNRFFRLNAIWAARGMCGDIMSGRIQQVDL